MNQKGFAAIILIVLGVIVVSLGIVGGTIYYKNKYLNQSSKSNSQLLSNQKSEDLEVFTSKRFGYKLSYPKSLKIFDSRSRQEEFIRSSSIPQFSLTSPDIKYHENKTNLIAGFIIKMTLSLDKDVDREFAWNYAEVYLNNNMGPRVDNSLIPSNLKLPKEASAGAYRSKRGTLVDPIKKEISDIAVIDIFTTNLLNSFKGKRAAFVFSCDGELDKCIPVLKEIVSSFELLDQSQLAAISADPTPAPTSSPEQLEDRFLIAGDLQLKTYLLFCQYHYFKKYPDKIDSIDPKCNTDELKSELMKSLNGKKIPEYNFSYQQTNNGEGFDLMTTLVSIGDVEYTEKGTTLDGKFTPYPYNPYTPPEELSKRSRDANRLADFANLQNAISVVIQQSTKQTDVFCIDGKKPCFGDSRNLNSKHADGLGWVKANLLKGSVPISSLPVDPINNSILHYSFCSDGTNWELNTTLESDQTKSKMKNDGGDNDNLYEMGSSLNLVGKATGCQY